MNRDRFTTKSQDALAAAISLAATHRHTQVTAEHLLEALLDEVAPFLAKVGVRASVVRAELEPALARLATHAEEAQEPTTSDAVRQVLRAAEHESATLGDAYVTCLLYTSDAADE